MVYFRESFLRLVFDQSVLILVYYRKSVLRLVSDHSRLILIFVIKITFLLGFSFLSLIHFKSIVRSIFHYRSL